MRGILYAYRGELWAEMFGEHFRTFSAILT